MLSLKQLEQVCLINGPATETCRYLKQDDINYQNWYCIKHRKSIKKKIDERLQEMLLDCKRKGIDPDTLDINMGDNCQGFPVLKHIEQGI